MPATKPPVRMVCADCGSDEVKADAYAEWNIEAQRWEVAETFGKGGWCDACAGECRIEPRPLDPAPR